jgi:SagB-type dehydrogenase family enzyme
MPQQEIVLPPPQLSSQNSLEEAIAQRRSHRSFGPQELSWEQIGQLAWSALGITGGDPRWRSAPSAGALHSLELYLLLPGSIYHYDPVAHRFTFHQPVLLSEVAAAALNQQFIAQAPCTFAFAANATRTTQVYKKRGWNYVCMDLGHAAQNLLLQATALGLVGTPVGALDEAALNAILKLPADQQLLYLVPIGYPG